MMETELQKLRIDKHHKAARPGKSRWPWLLLLFLLAAAAAGAWQWRNAAHALPVETLRVRLPDAGTRQDDLVLLNATGYIMAAHRVELSSKVIGRVAWVGVEMGDLVKKGQVLVRLEDDEFKTRLAQQQALLDSAKARLAELVAGPRDQEIAQAKAQLDRALVEADNAERDYKRLSAIRATRSLSQPELDDAESLMKSRSIQVESQRQQYELLKAGTRPEQINAQKATVAQLQAALDQAQTDLENTVIRAPADSTILERNVEVGEFVTTGFVGDRGAKGFVVSIADLNDLLVELDISQNDFAKVVDQQPCWIVTDAYPDKKYRGTVQLIAPVANRQKATIEVRVKVEDPDGLLKPDMNATVSFLSPTRAASGPAAATAPQAESPSLRIPASALRESAVFVVEQGKAVKRPITRGRTTAGGDIEIKKGLIGGEDLILHPPESLKEGDAVKIQESASH
jgi:HlyD family secretion protein